MASFPLDLKEETVTLMMVDEYQIFADPSSTYVIKGVLGELEQEGTIVAPIEAGEELVQEGAEEALEFLAKEVYSDGGRDDLHVEVKRKEESPGCTRMSRKLTRCSLRLTVLTRSIPHVGIVMMASASESPTPVWVTP